MADEDAYSEAAGILRAKRDASLCGYCRDELGVLIESVEALSEIDSNVARLVVAEAQAERSEHLQGTRGRLMELRDKSREMAGLSREVAGPSYGGGLLRIRDVVASAREGALGAIPRPLGFLNDMRGVENVRRTGPAKDHR
jgi:hypothetical protein